MFCKLLCRTTSIQTVPGDLASRWTLGSTWALTAVKGARIQRLQQQVHKPLDQGKPLFPFLSSFNHSWNCASNLEAPLIQERCWSAWGNPPEATRRVSTGACKLWGGAELLVWPGKEKALGAYRSHQVPRQGLQRTQPCSSLRKENGTLWTGYTEHIPLGIIKDWYRSPVELKNLCPWRCRQSPEQAGIESALSQLWARGWTTQSPRNLSNPKDSMAFVTSTSGAQDISL